MLMFFCTYHIIIIYKEIKIQWVIIWFRGGFVGLKLLFHIIENYDVYNGNTCGPHCKSNGCYFATTNAIKNLVAIARK